MSKHVVRNPIESLAELANQAPRLYEVVSRLGSQRRPRRVARLTRDAGWLGAGLLAGAGLVALLTPKTGPEIRREISDQAHRVRDSIKPRANGSARRTISGDLS